MQIIDTGIDNGYHQLIVTGSLIPGSNRINAFTRAKMPLLGKPWIVRNSSFTDFMIQLCRFNTGHILVFSYSFIDISTTG